MQEDPRTPNRDSDSDLYLRYGDKAREWKTRVQVVIGLATLVTLLVYFVVQGLSGDLAGLSLDRATQRILGGVGVGLAAAAAVELAYTLLTPGPDEALDPLMLGIAAAMLLMVGGLDRHTADDVAVPLLLLGLLLTVLFATRLMLAESSDPPSVWWVDLLRGRVPRRGDVAEVPPNHPATADPPADTP